MGPRPRLRRWVWLAIAQRDPAVSISVVPAVSSGAGQTVPTGVAKIHHVVVLMQENRSYDSYFGALHNRRTARLTDRADHEEPEPAEAGTRSMPFLRTNDCTVADLNHSWNGTAPGIQRRSDERLHRPERTPPIRPAAARWATSTKRRVPFYYGIANQFCDRRSLLRVGSWADVPEPVLPADRHVVRIHRATISVQTATRKRRSSNPRRGPTRSAGRSTSCHSRSRNSSRTCRTTSPVTFHDARSTSPTPRRGRCPQVRSSIDQFGAVNTENDEHPPANPKIGETFTHDVRRAGEEPELGVSAMFLTYDEHGGLYDHVAPPAAPKPDTSPF